MGPRVFAVVVAAGALVALATTAARADDLAAAQQHLDAGVARYQAGDFDGARVELIAARDAAPGKPNPYRWLALAEVRLGNCAEAIVHVEGFLARVATDDPRIDELARLRDQCRATGHVRVVSRPTGATVHVDAHATALTPADLALSVGSHVLVVDKAGFGSATRTVLVGAAASTDEHFTLSPIAAPAAERHRWWLWATIGVAIVAVAGGTAYALTRGHDDPRLPPIACDGAGCR